jgi:hypothetical protein
MVHRAAVSGRLAFDTGRYPESVKAGQQLLALDLCREDLLERSPAAGISGPWAEGAAVGVGTPTVRLKCRRSVVAVPTPADAAMEQRRGGRFHPLFHLRVTPAGGARCS